MLDGVVEAGPARPVEHGGSPEADASAVWFGLVASCMLQGIDPMADLRDVLPGLGKKTKSELRGAYGPSPPRGSSPTCVLHGINPQDYPASRIDDLPAEASRRGGARRQPGVARSGTARESSRE